MFLKEFGHFCLFVPPKMDFGCSHLDSGSSGTSPCLKLFSENSRNHLKHILKLHSLICPLPLGSKQPENTTLIDRIMKFKWCDTWNQAVTHQSIDKNRTFCIRYSDFSQCWYRTFTYYHIVKVEHVSKQLPVYTSSSQAATRAPSLRLWDVFTLTCVKILCEFVTLREYRWAEADNIDWLMSSLQSTLHADPSVQP